MTEFLGRVAGWFGRRLDDVISDPGAPGAALLAIGLVLAFVGLGWVRRISDPGSLARGEARWRYRDQSLLERLDGETRGWWITRIEFGIAITAFVIGFVLLVALVPGLTFRDPRPAPSILLQLAGGPGMLFGLWWMVRIYRAGLRNDAEATWRFRDRRP